MHSSTYNLLGFFSYETVSFKIELINRIEYSVFIAIWFVFKILSFHTSKQNMGFWLFFINKCIWTHIINYSLILKYEHQNNWGLNYMMQRLKRKILSWNNGLKGTFKINGYEISRKLLLVVTCYVMQHLFYSNEK